jgi:mono/diheme cytochrome c family protein
MIILRLTITVLSFIAIICATCLVHIEKSVKFIGNQEEVTETEIPEFLASAPHDKYGEMIRLGYKLFTQTPLYAKRYVGNELSCTNCHMDAGRRPLAVPMGPAYVAYPTWRKKDDRVNYFDDRIQQCFRYSLNGIPPALGSIELQALTAYASWLAKGLPMGDQMVKGRGLYQIPNTGRDPNHDRGRTIYKDRCAPCHGADGYRRTKLFQRELLAALKIVQRGDLRRSVPDVLASTANLLKVNGWRAGAPFGEGTANFEVMREWNRSVVYWKTMVLFAERLSGL